MKLHKIQTNLNNYLYSILPKVCDVDPEPLSKYVITLLERDESRDELMLSCTKKLNEFLGEATQSFVIDLFKFVEAEKKKADQNMKQHDDVDRRRDDVDRRRRDDDRRRRDGDRRRRDGDRRMGGDRREDDRKRRRYNSRSPPPYGKRHRSRSRSPRRHDRRNDRYHNNDNNRSRLNGFNDRRINNEKHYNDFNDRPHHQQSYHARSSDTTEITTSYHNRKQQSYDRYNSEEDRVTIIVINVPTEINTIESMKKEFEKFGNIVDVRPNIGRSSCYIRFEKRDEAISALDSELNPFNNQLIKTKWARSTEENKAERFHTKDLKRQNYLRRGQNERLNTYNSNRPYAPKKPRNEFRTSNYVVEKQPLSKVFEEVTKPQSPAKSAVNLINLRQQLLNKQIEQQKAMLTQLEDSNMSNENRLMLTNKLKELGKQIEDAMKKQRELTEKVKESVLKQKLDEVESIGKSMGILDKNGQEVNRRHLAKENKRFSLDLRSSTVKILNDDDKKEVNLIQIFQTYNGENIGRSSDDKLLIKFPNRNIAEKAVRDQKCEFEWVNTNDNNNDDDDDAVPKPLDIDEINDSD